MDQFSVYYQTVVVQTLNISHQRHSVIIPATQYDIYNYSYSLRLIRVFTASCYVLIAIKTIQGLAYQ